MQDILSMLQGRVLTEEECLDLVYMAICRTKTDPCKAIVEMLNVKPSNKNNTHGGKIRPGAIPDMINVRRPNVAMDESDGRLQHLLGQKGIIYDIKFDPCASPFIKLRCPACNNEQSVSFADYYRNKHGFFLGEKPPEGSLITGFHPYICTCGDHIELLPVIQINVRVAQPVKNVNNGAWNIDFAGSSMRVIIEGPKMEVQQLDMGECETVDDYCGPIFG